ncbi:hypothetical protein D3C78_1248470 [compost metagenome]
MARFTFQQHVLDLTVFIQIPVRVGLPVFLNQLALDHAGLFRVGAHVIGFVIAVQRFAGRLFVVEHDRDIVCACLINHHRGSRWIHQVNRQRFYALGDQHVDLVVLFGLVVLRVIHQQGDIRRGLGVFLDCLAHHRHKVVVIFIHRDANTGICVSCGAKHHGCGRRGQGENLLIHCVSPVYVGSCSVLGQGQPAVSARPGLAVSLSSVNHVIPEKGGASAR